jgi:hypothetical protein
MKNLDFTWAVATPHFGDIARYLPCGFERIVKKPDFYGRLCRNFDGTYAFVPYHWHQNADGKD